MRFMKAKTRYFSGEVISRQVAACEATRAAREISVLFSISPSAWPPKEWPI